MRLFARGRFGNVSLLRNGPIGSSLFLKQGKDDRYSWARQAGLLATVPFLLAAPPIIGLLIGRFLDNRFNTTPILTIVFIVLGFIAGAREVASVLRKASEGDKQDERNRNGPKEP